MNEIAAFNDIASGVANSVLAILAALGLKTWRKQLLGTTEYELARRLLRAVYRVRDEVARFRSPLMSGGETTAAVKTSGEALPDDFEKASLRSYELTYEARWRRLVDVLSDFEAELVEAEVLWGTQSVENAQLLRATTSKLSIATRAHLKGRIQTPRGENAQAGLEVALDYAQTRKQFGRPIVDNQGLQWMLADMAKDIQAARLLVRDAAARLDAGALATSACSMAKCFAGDIAVQHTANAVQIFGGSGYIRGFEVERLFRDAKITQIYEGTNQIQRMIIARKLLQA